MPPFTHELALQAACDASIIPGAVMAAADASGKFQYMKAFGKTVHGETLSTDSVMLTGGCTNLLTTVAALQQVSAGKFDLDQDVASVLPELSALEVLTGFDEHGKPVFESRRGVITLRHLLAHTSGTAYAFMDTKLQKLSQYRAAHHASTTANSYIDLISDALLFDPGKGWAYSTGFGWAGKLVERVSGLPLEQYMRENIWDPLGMQHMSFFPGSHDEIATRRVGMSLRDPTGKLVPSPDSLPTQFFEATPGTDAYGGGGCWGSAQSFLPLLQSICANDGRVLSPDLVDEMFRPQLGQSLQEAMNDTVQSIPEFKTTFGRVFDVDAQVLNNGLGGDIGIRNEAGRQRAGTMCWLGLPNTVCWVDREAGLCGLYFSQLLPMGDETVNEFMTLFQMSIYEGYKLLA